MRPGNVRKPEQVVRRIITRRYRGDAAKQRDNVPFFTVFQIA
jgi:hypothetical protein